MNNEVQALIDKLPPWIKEPVQACSENLEEIVIDEGEVLHLRVSEGEPYRYIDKIATATDIKYICARIGRFKENGRAGIPGTLHRISEKLDDRGQRIGLTIRFARHVHGVATPLTPYLEQDGSMLVIGSPGKGKTTLLRDMVRIRAEVNHKQTCVCDSNGEIGGHSVLAHPCLGKARRFHVANIRDQARVLTRIIQNHSPIDIIVDEMGYNEDVEIAEKASRSGVRIIGTVHGETITDVLDNPMLGPLLGYPDKATQRRRGKPAFSMALEVVAKGHYRIFTDLAKAVDAMLIGEIPEGVDLAISLHRRNRSQTRIGKVTKVTFNSLGELV